jgi:hypothetical protein
MTNEDYGYDLCDDFTYTLYKLDLFHNRVVRSWYTRQLAILLVALRDARNQDIADLENH